MISLRITSVAFMAAVIISGVDAYPIAQASDPNAGLAAPPTPDTGSSTPTVPATETATTGIVSPTLMPDHNQSCAAEEEGQGQGTHQGLQAQDASFGQQQQQAQKLETGPRCGG
ncbi:hypothetical protein MCOR25_004296 [Pyricularia grisea]|nr:hypothetical protein MCOR25_004296 [Pyricularia grisea]